MEQRVVCQNCGGFLLTAYGTVIATVTCRKCKTANNIKIISGDHSHDVHFKFAKDSSQHKRCTSPKKSSTIGVQLKAI